MPQFQFNMLCKDKEACKRVRFMMQTGVTVKPLKYKLPKRSVSVLGKYLKPLPCKHKIPLSVQDELKEDMEHSIEYQCEKCNRILTLIPFLSETNCVVNQAPYKLQKLFAIVDFPNYDKIGI